MNAVAPAPNAWQTSPIREALGLAYRWLLHVPDRVTHASRRAKAIAALAAGSPPQRVLFMCLGNVCRSPYAEVASRRDAAFWPSPSPEWCSAGFIGPDRPAPPLAIEVAAARGAPLDAHRSQVVTRELALESDLIVVMEAYQAEQLAERYGRRRGVIVLGDFDPKPITSRAIPDPWNKAREDFVASYERIDRCLAVLATTISTAAR